MSEHPGSVLLVDDQPANLEVLSRLLGGHGYHVRAVTSGTRALEAARLSAPECIVLDVAMPDLDGFATCRTLARIPELADVPVIFITAFDDTEHKLEAFAAGGRDYVTKPFQAEEVLARVGTQVKSYRMAHKLQQQNEQLLAANAQLEELATMRSKLSATLVHDLRSPLMVLGAVLSDPSDTEILADARISYAKVQRLLGELLELYRGQHLQDELRRKHVDLVALARESVTAARHTAKARSIELSLECELAALDVNVDPEKLDRILSNLLDNALKFTPAGGHINVHVDREHGHGVEAGLEFAAITVTDTGPGIPAEDLPYVFDPYRQRSDAKAKGGVGLGLSIVQRLVAGHGGRLRVFSCVGVGTEFRVLLPL
ncbi:MAG: hybrid sensor histidine kinase/response regulator [Myxococcota bacterium]